MHGSDVHVARRKLTKFEIHDMRRLYDKSYKRRSTQTWHYRFHSDEASIITQNGLKYPYI